MYKQIITSHLKSNFKRFIPKTYLIWLFIKYEIIFKTIIYVQINETTKIISNYSNAFIIGFLTDTDYQKPFLIKISI